MTDQPTKTKLEKRVRAPGKVKVMQLDDSDDVKDRQSSKIKELSDALVAAGFCSLDEQAVALGLSRSTTWTILKAKHKNYGLSGALVNRILQRPGLDRRVRAKLIEYVHEKAAGSFGHNKTQLRRFKHRLSAEKNSALDNKLGLSNAGSNQAAARLSKPGRLDDRKT